MLNNIIFIYENDLIKKIHTFNQKTKNVPDAHKESNKINNKQIR